MESLDKLRNGMGGYGTGDRHFVTLKAKKFDEYCDAIQAEIEVNYMELPKDANGVPIHVGDRLEWCGEYIDVNGVCKDAVWFKPGCDQEWKCIWSNTTRHYKPRTVEDVLRDVWKEALDYAKSDIWRNSDEVFAERADEIRELLRSDE